MPSSLSARASSLLRRVHGIAQARRRMNREAVSDRGPRAEELRGEYDRIGEDERAGFIGECISDVATAVAAALTPPFVDTTSIVKGSADGTKQVRIEADDITTGTTRVIEMPDQNVSLAPHWSVPLLAAQVFGS